MAQNKKLSTSQIDAINALLESKSVAEASKIGNVSRSTLYRWFKLPAFIEGLRAGEGVILDRVARKLILLAEKAVAALENVMNDPDQDGAAQKRYAAATILDNVLRLWELRNLEERITALESKAFLGN